MSPHQTLEALCQVPEWAATESEARFGSINFESRSGVARILVAGDFRRSEGGGRGAAGSRKCCRSGMAANGADEAQARVDIRTRAF